MDRLPAEDCIPLSRMLNYLHTHVKREANAVDDLCALNSLLTEDRLLPVGKRKFEYVNSRAKVSTNWELLQHAMVCVHFLSDFSLFFV